MKKILIYGISNQIGGVENILLEIVAHSDRTKLQFDILTYYDHIAYHQEFERLGCKIYRITSKHHNPFKNRREFHRFFQEHAQEYEAVWCNLSELINIDILKWAKKYSIPRRIIHSHATSSTRSKLLTRLHSINRKKIGQIATDFWACSYLAGQWFYSEELLKSSRFQIIHNAIDLPKYSFHASVREELRQQFHLEGKFVVGHVGRMVIAQKNTLFLLESFAQLLKKESNAVLMLVGDGPDRPLVEQKIAELQLGDHVLLLGNRNDVPRLLNAMDAFVLPSISEGLGIVLIEAQASGLFSFTSADVVPKEAAVTELLEFVSLQKEAEYWADRILLSKDKDRVDTTDAIVKAGYDINREINRIQKLLLQEE